MICLSWSFSSVSAQLPRTFVVTSWGKWTALQWGWDSAVMGIFLQTLGKKHGIRTVVKYQETQESNVFRHCIWVMVTPPYWNMILSESFWFFSGLTMTQISQPTFGGTSSWAMGIFSWDLPSNWWPKQGKPKEILGVNNGRWVKQLVKGTLILIFPNLHGNMSEAGNHFLWYLPRLAPIPDLQNPSDIIWGG